MSRATRVTGPVGPADTRAASRRVYVPPAKSCGRDPDRTSTRTACARRISSAAMMELTAWRPARRTASWNEMRSMAAPGATTFDSAPAGAGFVPAPAGTSIAPTPVRGAT